MTEQSIIVGQTAIDTILNKSSGLLFNKYIDGKKKNFQRDNAVNMINSIAQFAHLDKLPEIETMHNKIHQHHEEPVLKTLLKYSIALQA